MFIGMSSDIIERAKLVGWIEPEIDVNRLTSYSPGALRLLFARIKREGLPPPKRSQKGGEQMPSQCPAESAEV